MEKDTLFILGDKWTPDGQKSTHLNDDLGIARCHDFAVLPTRGTTLSAGIDFYVPICEQDVTDYKAADDMMQKYLDSATACVNRETIREIWVQTIASNKETITNWKKTINSFILLSCLNEELPKSELMQLRFDIQQKGALSVDPLYDIMVPSGICVDMHPNTMFTAFNKSGVAGKKKLQVGACVVDIDYRGQVHVNLHNIGHKPVEIKNGDKISQFVIIPIGLGTPYEVNYEIYKQLTTSRGSGAFGSTGESK